MTGEHAVDDGLLTRAEVGVAEEGLEGAAGIGHTSCVGALLIGLVAFPGAFLARALVARMPLHVHTAILDAVVLIGGLAMIVGALTR